MKTVFSMLVILLVPILLFGQSNTGNVSQTGSGNTGYIDQLGGFNSGIITTSGSNNNDGTLGGAAGTIGFWTLSQAMLANGITQVGNTNTGLITQVATSSNNVAGMYQLGNSNKMGIEQNGDGNVAYVDQIGNGNGVGGYFAVGTVGGTGQRQYYNYGNVFQYGPSNTAVMYTNGNNNYSTIQMGWLGGGFNTKSNSGYAEIYQLGDNNEAFQEQYRGSAASPNGEYIHQAGGTNSAYQVEEGLGNLAKIWQINTGTQRNVGDQVAGYASNFNTTLLRQVGTDDYSFQYADGGNNNYTITDQLGDTDWSFVWQSGNNNWASATQTGNNNWSKQLQSKDLNTSTVIQTGNFNWSFVHQH